MTRRRKDQPTRFCLDCGYALHGLSANRCPECGRPFNPRDRKTWSGPEPKKRDRPLEWWIPTVLGYSLASVMNGFVIGQMADFLLFDMDERTLKVWSGVLSLGMLAVFVWFGRTVRIGGRSGKTWGGILGTRAFLAAFIGVTIQILVGWALSLSDEAERLIPICVFLPVFWALVGIAYVHSNRIDG